MAERDLVYLTHMLDTAERVRGKIEGIMVGMKLEYVRPALRMTRGL